MTHSGQTREIAVTGLEQEPGKEADHLRAIRDRLERLMGLVKLGGPEEAGDWVQLANQEMRQVYPEARLLTLADMSSGTKRADGSVFVQFVGGRVNETDSIRVSISARANGDYGVKVLPPVEQQPR